MNMGKCVGNIDCCLSKHVFCTGKVNNSSTLTNRGIYEIFLNNVSRWIEVEGLVLPETCFVLNLIHWISDSISFAPETWQVFPIYIKISCIHETWQFLEVQVQFKFLFIKLPNLNVQVVTILISLHRRLRHKTTMP